MADIGDFWSKAIFNAKVHYLYYCCNACVDGMSATIKTGLHFLSAPSRAAVLAAAAAAAKADLREDYIRKGT